ncbi:MAG: penicillin-binding protein [Dysgonomonas sp.]
MAEDNKMNLKEKRSKIAINRYGFIVIFLSFIFIAVLVSIVRIMFIEGDFWRAIGERESIKKDRVILPNRGNIYACDGRLLATSEPLYGIYMDFMADGIVKDTLMKYVNDLSKSLSQKFPDRTAAQYKKIIMDGWALSRKELAQMERAKANGSSERIRTKSRYVRIIRRDINYLDLKELYKFPFFNQRSNKTGLIAEERTMRKKPFGRLAGRTVGSIYKDINQGGASGIELKYDVVLRGDSGLRNRQKVQGRWIDIVEVPAVDGMDVLTTIDVDIQDIVEKALYAKLAETDAESGCAIIMEVETGEIKGISNLDRIATGIYAEGNPNAFSYMSEPGSTFKTVSVMAALEDGLITPEDSFYVGNGVYEYNRRQIRDHYWRKGQDRGFLTLTEGMEVSSNVVISKAILKAYENNPEKYVQHIYDFGLTKKIDWDVPLKGREGTVNIRHPKDKANPWSKTTLAWMSFGYETQVPPIYMLMFYNGIANNGKMIKPFITKEFLRNGKVVEEFGTEVINPSLCSERTLAQIKDILRKVVTNGTAKVVDSDLFEIAGKTGTALIATGGSYSGYYVSFCGYFPADKPKYTCFVGIRRPKGIPSGGGMPGAVFKNIAERVYAQSFRLTPKDYKADSTGFARKVFVKNGAYDKTKYLFSQLDIPFKDLDASGNWISCIAEPDKVEMKRKEVSPDLVPDVTGMGARDALFALEHSGLRVSLSGAGKVVSQSITPGTHIVRGTHINIHLE